METKWCQINTKCWEKATSTVQPPARKISSVFRMVQTTFSASSCTLLGEQKTANGKNANNKFLLISKSKIIVQCLNFDSKALQVARLRKHLLLGLK